MPHYIKKHRLEQETYSVDFQNQAGTNVDVDGGETLSSPSIEVQRFEAGAWVDKTTEFGTPGPQVDGTEVDFKLQAAGGTDQARGWYVVIASAQSSLAGRGPLFELVPLFVTDVASG